MEPGEKNGTIPEIRHAYFQWRKMSARELRLARVNPCDWAMWAMIIITITIDVVDNDYNIASHFCHWECIFIYNIIIIVFSLQ